MFLDDNPNYESLNGLLLNKDLAKLIAVPGGLTSMTIPNSVTSIGQSAFYGCMSLTEVIIPNSVTSIGQSAFSNCMRLTSVTIPNSVTSIGQSAFVFCNGLTSVTIPNSVTSIGDYAFSDCMRLESVLIGTSIESIGNDAFKYCTLIKSAYPNTLRNPFRSGIAVDYNPDGAIIEDGWIYGPEKKEIRFAPHTLEGEYMIPQTIKSISEKAFSGCINLTLIEIPNSVTSIGGEAFSGCINLTLIEIPNSVTSIGDYAFSGCSGLTSVTVPNSVTSIGNSAFSGCSGLETVIYNAENCNSSGPFFPTSIKVLTIGNNVKTIPDSAFEGSNCLTSVEIPNTVTSIGSSAFFGCSGLTSVTIPNSVTSIGDNAFSGCSGLSSVTIANSVTSIGNNAFEGCDELKKSEFASIESLCKINFGNENSNPLGITHNLLINGEEITDVLIPNSITSIGNYAFYGCDNVKSVIIPGSVSSIGNKAFAGCKLLSTIYSYNTTPPAAGSNTFNEVPYDAIVYVPKGRALAYSNHSGWKAFYDFREMGALSVTLNKNSLSMNINETETIVANIGNPENAGIKSEEWTSTNPAVATVENGVVTAVSAGTATINFIVTDEYNMTYYASCTVTVTDTNSIESVSADEASDMEIFTMQGIRVMNTDYLAPGIYIVKCGNKSRKILVK